MNAKVLKSQRLHLGIFGRRNNGKSSIINVLTKQDVAIVSDVAGTTTDPVSKTIEIFGIGPVVIIDTAGIDDENEIGEKRIAKSYATIRSCDLAILVIANNTFGSYEEKLIAEFEKYNLSYLIIHNKNDLNALQSQFKDELKRKWAVDVIEFSATQPTNFTAVVELIKKNLPNSVYNNPTLFGDLIKPFAHVLMIMPIDAETPQGRIILPEVQAIRDGLDHQAITTVITEKEIDAYFEANYPQPDLVITDSQAFGYVSQKIPEPIPLTSFSILLARIKGPFESYLKGTVAIENLQEHDKVLILESCSHHDLHDDIGRVKIPNWLQQYTGKNLICEKTVGLNQPKEKLKEYKIIIQCGGCMLTRTQIINRLQPAIDFGVPVTNYGMAIAYCHHIFERAIKPFENKFE